MPEEWLTVWAFPAAVHICDHQILVAISCCIQQIFQFILCLTTYMLQLANWVIHSWVVLFDGTLYSSRGNLRNQGTLTFVPTEQYCHCEAIAAQHTWDSLHPAEHHLVISYKLLVRRLSHPHPSCRHTRAVVVLDATQGFEVHSAFQLFRVAQHSERPATMLLVYYQLDASSFEARL
jgi:hypothetical protein